MSRQERAPGGTSLTWLAQAGREFRGGRVAVGGGRALGERRRLELVLLRADRLEDVHGHQVAELDRALGGQAPGHGGEEAAAERVARAGRLHEPGIRDRADNDRLLALLLNAGAGRAEGDDAG